MARLLGTRGMDRVATTCKPKQRYDPHSKLNRLNDKYRHIITREHEIWTPEEKDLLWELWLVHGLTRFYPETPGPRFCVILRRSFRSIDTAAWKLAACYKDFHYVRGGGRSDRSRTPVTWRDNALLSAVSQPAAVANGALEDYNHLAMLTARPVAQVREWVHGYVARIPSTEVKTRLKQQGGVLTWEQIRAALIHDANEGRNVFVMRLGAPSEYK